jgi:hypothetical protein
MSTPCEECRVHLQGTLDTLSVSTAKGLAFVMKYTAEKTCVVFCLYRNSAEEHYAVTDTQESPTAPEHKNCSFTIGVSLSSILTAGAELGCYLSTSKANLITGHGGP